MYVEFRCTIALMNGDNPQKPDQDQGQTDAAQWQYKPEQGTGTVSGPLSSPAPNLPENRTSQPQDVTWTASEFVAHAKGFSWFAMLVVGTAALTAITWFVTQDYISVGVIIVLAILLGVAATRQPRVLEYRVDNEGIEIAGKFFSYADFRSFSIMPEGAFSSIMLVPLRRFAPPLSIYYDPTDEEKIVSVISQHLPLEERQHDMIDRFARRIRF